MGTLRVAALPGDGIGVEVVAAALDVLDAVARTHAFDYSVAEGQVGGRAIDVTGDPLPKDVLELARRSDAVLFGAVGGPKWDARPVDSNPEQAIIGLRRALRCFANLRYVRSWPHLRGLGPIKPEVLDDGVDIVMVRELTEDIYHGQPKETVQTATGWRAVDTAVYTSEAIDRITRYALDLAASRSGQLVVIGKPNVLATSKLFCDRAMDLAARAGIAARREIVDAATCHLVARPAAYDVILTTNQFGDILGDELALLCGSIGLLPSAAISEIGVNLYEPVHGSAPDIAGEDRANPIAAILCVALMLRHTAGRPDLADAVEYAVDRALGRGGRTADLVTGAPGERVVGCREFTRAVVDEITTGGH